MAKNDSPKSFNVKITLYIDFQIFFKLELYLQVLRRIHQMFPKTSLKKYKDCWIYYIMVSSRLIKLSVYKTVSLNKIKLNIYMYENKFILSVYVYSLSFIVFLNISNILLLIFSGSLFQ